MQWTEWQDEQGTCFNAGPYTIAQRDGGQWLLEGPALSEMRSDLDLLKMIADDHAAKWSQSDAMRSALGTPSPPAKVDTSEYQLDINELKRTVTRMSKVARSVNPYTDPVVGRSRDALTEVANELQRIIDRLP